MDQGTLKRRCDALLDRIVRGSPAVPGVAAVITDRERDLYRGAAGERVQGDGIPMTTDTVCAIFSCTKAITATVCLQLWERGLLDLDAPAQEHVPALGDLQVLEGFDELGRPELRPPRRPITTRMLLLHTAGFGYDFFNATYSRLRRAHGQPSVLQAAMASLRTPLLFDPGSRWEYGSSVDWAGQVVEAVAGRRLGEVMKAEIFEPLGMRSTAFTLDEDMRGRLACVHQRAEDGSLLALRDFVLEQDPEVQMGGHGLYSTPEDYAKFIRVWLADGRGPSGPILKRETVEMAARNGLGELKIRALPTMNPKVTHTAEFFPGMPKSWALSFMVNEEEAPTGRPPGQLAWAGLGNLYFWIDRKNGVGGFWATQIFPFADPTSVGGYLDLETEVYEALAHA